MRLFESTDSLVAVVAHPDDAELMFYGSLRIALARGAEVTVLLATDGEAGISLTDSETRSLPDGKRLAETSHAFARTTVRLEGLHLPDGRLGGVLDLTVHIEKFLRSRECSTVLTHDPEATNDHQDHLALGRATINAARRAGCKTILVGHPTQPGSDFRPNTLVDITPYLEEKVIALRQHQSQSGRWYLSPRFTTNRAEAVGWEDFPAGASRGRTYEALRQVLCVDEGIQ